MSNPSLPTITGRRGFLAGGAGLLASVLGSPAIAKIVAENPDLVRLGEQLEIAISAFDQAEKNKVAARRDFDSKAPVVPQELVLSRSEFEHFRGYQEVDIEGKQVHCDGYPMGRRIATTKTLAPVIENYSARSAVGRAARRKMKTAMQYEEELAKAERDSGIEKAFADFAMAEFPLQKLCWKISETPANTMVGVRIKARSLDRFARMGHEQRYKAGLWGPSLAEALLNAGGRL